MRRGLRIDILGPMRGWDGDRELDLGPVRQQALLAYLALRANRIVPVDELLDAVWGDRLPASGVKIIPPYVYRVRRIVGGPDCLARTRDGYVLRLDPDAVDLNRFEVAVEASRQAQDPEQAADLLSAALGEWRGEPLTALPGPGLVATRHQLRERRLQILAERIALDLECGRHSESLPELAALVDEHPLNERFAGLKMLALHRSGRQADALDTYLKTRTNLVEQLGVEPGPELCEVHQTVLGVSSVATPRDELPRDIPDFVGREAELAAVLDHLVAVDRPAPPVVVIDGMAGVGKTGLAIHTARRLTSEYPDGRLFLDLHGHTPDHEPTTPSAALDRLLRTIGIPADQIPPDLDERTALWRAELANRRLLLLLDNTANTQQIQPLLPGGTGCAVLITSRRQLTGLDATHRISLDMFSPAEATSLLLAIIGRGSAADAEQLVDACGRLPLAVRIAGARLKHRPGWTIEQLTERLASPQRRLAELAGEDGGVGQAFDLSYRHLPADQQRMFRLLGLMPGADIDTPAAAALTAIDPTAADQLVNALVDTSLLLTSSPGRFTFHDLLRGYAKRCAEAESLSDRDAALIRLHTWYLHSAANAKQALGNFVVVTDLGGPEPGTHPAAFEESAAAFEWFDREWRTLVSVVRDAATLGWHVTAWQLAHMMIPYLLDRSLMSDLFAVLRIAIRSAEHTGDNVAIATCANHLGMTYSQDPTGDMRAIAYLERAVRLYGQAGHDRGLASALGNLGIALVDIGRADDAVVHYRQSIDLDHRLGDLDSEARHLNNLAMAYIRLENYDRAITASRQAVKLHEIRGSHRGMAYAFDTLGLALAGRGHHHEAIGQYRQALALRIESDDQRNTCITLTNLGRAQHASGLIDDARASWQQALDFYDDLGVADNADLRRSDLVNLLDPQPRQPAPSASAAQPSD